jgi:hypothetical protein
LIRRYFRNHLSSARQSRTLRKGRIFGISAAAATAAVLLSVLLIRTPAPQPLVTTITPPPNTEAIAAVETAVPVKKDEPDAPARTKPSAEPSATPDRKASLSAPTLPNAPDFLVTDPAGYSHRLEEYRGHLVLLAVWSSDQSDSISAIEKLYKTHAANSKLRFLGVSNQPQVKPPNTTFPVLYNQGSKLLGAQPGEFVLLDENGAVELRGSLVRDFDAITKALRSK